MDFGAVAELAFYPNGALVFFYEFFGEYESEACAAFVCCAFVAEVGVGAEEFLLVFFFDAYAVVFYCEVELCVFNG